MGHWGVGTLEEIVYMYITGLLSVGRFGYGRSSVFSVFSVFGREFDGRSPSQFAGGGSGGKGGSPPQEIQGGPLHSDIKNVM